MFSETPIWLLCATLQVAVNWRMWTDQLQLADESILQVHSALYLITRCSQCAAEVQVASHDDKCYEFSGLHRVLDMFVFALYAFRACFGKSLSS